MAGRNLFSILFGDISLDVGNLRIKNDCSQFSGIEGKFKHDLDNHDERNLFPEKSIWILTIYGGKPDNGYVKTTSSNVDRGSPQGLLNSAGDEVRNTGGNTVNHWLKKALLANLVIQLLSDIVGLVWPPIALVPSLIPAPVTAWVLTGALGVTILWNIGLAVRFIIQKPEGADDAAKLRHERQILRTLFSIFSMLVVLGVSVMLLWVDLKLPYWIPLIWIWFVFWAGLVQDILVSKKLLG